MGFPSACGTELRFDSGEGITIIPGGPWIHAISGDSNANLTAAFWLSLSVGSKKTTFSADILSEGAEIPNKTSISLVTGGVDLTSSCRRF